MNAWRRQQRRAGDGVLSVQTHALTENSKKRKLDVAGAEARYQAGLGQLAALPRELRSLVYGGVMPTADVVPATISQRDVDSAPRMGEGSLLRASEALHMEVQEELYERSTYEIDVANPLLRPAAHVHVLPYAHAASRGPVALGRRRQAAAR